MKLSQFHALVEEAVRAEGERQAGMILAVNLGSHGKKSDIEKVLNQLSGQETRQNWGEFERQFAPQK